MTIQVNTMSDFKTACIKAKRDNIRKYELCKHQQNKKVLMRENA